MVRQGNSKNIRECSPLGGDGRFCDQSTSLSYMRCTAASSTHSSLEGQRVTALRARQIWRPGQGPFNEQIAQNEKVALALPRLLTPSPPLASGECGPCLCFYPLIL